MQSKQKRETSGSEESCVNKRSPDDRTAEEKEDEEHEKRRQRRSESESQEKG